MPTRTGTSPLREWPQPGSIRLPALARALGLGFSVTREALTAFGEAAVPYVVAVTDDPERSNSDVGAALTTLRFIVETSAEPLSEDTLATIRETARDWLMTGDQSVLSLGAAIDLAAVLDDPALRDILAAIAADPDEIVNRGVDYPPSVSRLQSEAADRLTGGMPRPRP